MPSGQISKHAGAFYNRIPDAILTNVRLAFSPHWGGVIVFERLRGALLNPCGLWRHGCLHGEWPALVSLLRRRQCHAICLPEARRTADCSLEASDWELYGAVAPDGIRDAPIATSPMLQGRCAPMPSIGDASCSWLLVRPDGCTQPVLLGSFYAPYRGYPTGARLAWWEQFETAAIAAKAANPEARVIVAGDANIDFGLAAPRDTVRRAVDACLLRLGLHLAQGLGQEATHDAGATLDIVAAEPALGVTATVVPAPVLGSDHRLVLWTVRLPGVSSNPPLVPAGLGVKSTGHSRSIISCVALRAPRSHPLWTSPSPEASLASNPSSTPTGQRFPQAFGPRLHVSGAYVLQNGRAAHIVRGSRRMCIAHFVRDDAFFFGSRVVLARFEPAVTAPLVASLQG